MAVTITENYLSRKFTLALQAERYLIYDVQGTEDEELVRTTVLGVAPTVYLSRVLDSISCDPVGGGLWTAMAKYVRLSNADEYTFDTSGGTTKITQSLATIASYAPGGFTPPNFKGAIGVSEDKVEGVDITTPNYQFSETHWFTDAFVLAGFKRVLFDLTGRTNNASFKNMNIGECLFMGAAGSKRGDDNWSITFRFSGSPNISGATVGDITGITKAGWDYLWVRYADFVDSFAYALVKRPVACYVERVYPQGDFSTLTIGT